MRQEDRIRRQVSQPGIACGTALAIAISWSANELILGTIIHDLFSRLYVIYYTVRY
ncbi:hypothetical protein ES703_111396 [subsurface metagenome]